MGIREQVVELDEEQGHPEGPIDWTLGGEVTVRVTPTAPKLRGAVMELSPSSAHVWDGEHVVVFDRHTGRSASFGLGGAWTAAVVTGPRKKPAHAGKRLVELDVVAVPDDADLDALEAGEPLVEFEVIPGEEPQEAPKASARLEQEDDGDVFPHAGFSPYATCFGPKVVGVDPADGPDSHVVAIVRDDEPAAGPSLREERNRLRADLDEAEHYVEALKAERDRLRAELEALQVAHRACLRIDAQRVLKREADERQIAKLTRDLQTAQATIAGLSRDVGAATKRRDENMMLADGFARAAERHIVLLWDLRDGIGLLDAVALGVRKGFGSAT